MNNDPIFQFICATVSFVDLDVDVRHCEVHEIVAAIEPLEDEPSERTSPPHRRTRDCDVSTSLCWSGMEICWSETDGEFT